MITAQDVFIKARSVCTYQLDLLWGEPNYNDEIYKKLWGCWSKIRDTDLDKITTHEEHEKFVEQIHKVRVTVEATEFALNTTHKIILEPTRAIHYKIKKSEFLETLAAYELEIFFQ